MGLMVLFFIGSLRFLAHLPRPYALTFIGAGTVFLLGAIGFELLARDAIGKALHFSLSDSARFGIGVIEESLELIGIFIFNAALLFRINAIAPSTPARLPLRPFGIALLVCILDTLGTLLFNSPYC